MGLEIDLYNKVWLATTNQLLVLNQDLVLDKKFEVKKSQEYSSISIPDCTSGVIKMSSDQTTIFWYKNNVAIEQIDCKKWEIIQTYTNIVKLVDIERLMSIRLHHNMKYLYYFTKKSLLGDTIYKLDLTTGKKSLSWNFTN